jgi:tRNA-splicing ligase RtcB
MKKVINTEARPIKLWLENIEEGALKQAKNLANLPFTFKHIPLMPDCHQGYGMPIGSILATEGVVVPNAVGVDIGCGMCAMPTTLKHLNTKQLKKILGIARKSIPVGFKWHKTLQNKSLMPEIKTELPIITQEYTNATHQLGTLGGGNHFIEVQKGSDGFIWIMIHSGSRNLGYNVAKHYNNLAKQLNKKYFSSVTKDKDLAFLPIETPEAKLYINEMLFCVDFAFANRKLMMERVFEAIQEVSGECGRGEIINKSHNFAAWEKHFNKNVLVHRKGATRAFENELGMIPGSQGTKSFIVKGLGNQESFKSCSHGAGRKMGRKQAQRELSLEQEIANMEKQGIVHGIRHSKDLDEAPGAYKDIHEVMENQKDLAQIIVELMPLAVLKG